MTYGFYKWRVSILGEQCLWRALIICRSDNAGCHHWPPTSFSYGLPWDKRHKRGPPESAFLFLHFCLLVSPIFWLILGSFVKSHVSIYISLSLLKMSSFPPPPLNLMQILNFEFPERTFLWIIRISRKGIASEISFPFRLCISSLNFSAIGQEQKLIDF